MGDLLQRMQDHSRVEKFLTNQMLSVMFSMLSFAILGIVLFIYDKLIFVVFLTGSMAYGVWVAFFLISVEFLIMSCLKNKLKTTIIHISL